jgi:serine/threonine protein kinase
VQTLQNYAGYEIGGQKLSQADLCTLIQCVEQPTDDLPGTLGGRTAIKTLSLSSAWEGAVASGSMGLVLKEYRRGGLFQYVNKRHFFGTRMGRSQGEFASLEMARSAGVRVPRPIAFLRKGRFFYRCWLLLEEIEQAVTLAELSIRDASLASALMPAFVEQLDLLVRAGILHVDLHPGNVLVDANGELVVIDFDQARRVRVKPQVLRNRLVNRWNRAVKKHALAEGLLL